MGRSLAAGRQSASGQRTVSYVLPSREGQFGKHGRALNGRSHGSHCPPLPLKRSTHDKAFHIVGTNATRTEKVLPTAKVTGPNRRARSLSSRRARSSHIQPVGRRRWPISRRRRDHSTRRLVRCHVLQVEIRILHPSVELLLSQAVPFRSRLILPELVPGSLTQRVVPFYDQLRVAGKKPSDACCLFDRTP